MSGQEPDCKECEKLGDARCHHCPRIGERVMPCCMGSAARSNGDTLEFCTCGAEDERMTVAGLREEFVRQQSRIADLEAKLVEARMGKVDERLGRIRAEAREKLVHG